MRISQINSSHYKIFHSQSPTKKHSISAKDSPRTCECCRNHFVISSAAGDQRKGGGSRAHQLRQKYAKARHRFRYEYAQPVWPSAAPRQQVGLEESTTTETNTNNLRIPFSGTQLPQNDGCVGLLAEFKSKGCRVDFFGQAYTVASPVVDCHA